ncbi:MAG TPA: mannosyltransferase family protein [Phototrophicaceae bacterium]|nr:mannosyltransferase family protein [Phototrophicaceae bacterium]
MPRPYKNTITRRAVLLLIVAFLITRAAITAAGVLSLRFLESNEGDQFTHLLDKNALTPALDMWYRWDAGFYATIGTYGYDWLNQRKPADDMAFLPVYPLALHAVSGLTSTGCLASPYLSTCATVGGLAVSNVALLIALLLLFDLALTHFNRRTAWVSAILLLISPIGIFLSGVYTESLFLLLSLLTFWLLDQDRFVLAVVCASIACLTRSVGVALFLPLLWYAWNGERSLFGAPAPESVSGFSPLPDFREGSGVRSRFIRVILAFIPPILFGGYILLAGLTVGDPFAYFKTYASVWNRVAGTPIQAFTVYFSGQTVSWYGAPLSRLDLILTLFYLVLAILLLARAKTRLWGVFALVALLIPIASGTLIGMPRFGAVIFPFYILLGAWADRWYKQAILYVISAALALLFIARFVTWHWIA